jgi:hypothetical protein
VLVRMAFRIEHRERHDGLRRLRAIADDVTVHAKLERVTSRLTRIGLRVEAGRMTADRVTGTQMHEQIAALLAPAVARTPVTEAVAAETLTTLQADVQKLRSDIESRRAAEPPVSPSEPGTTMRVEPGAVVTVPISAALPTVGGPAPPVSVPAPAGAPPTSPTQSGPARPEAAEVTLGASMSTPLHPAGALTPIQAVTGVGNGK